MLVQVSFYNVMYNIIVILIMYVYILTLKLKFYSLPVDIASRDAAYEDMNRILSFNYILIIVPHIIIVQVSTSL